MLTTSIFEFSSDLPSLTQWTAFDDSHTIRVPHESVNFALVDGIGRKTDIGKNGCQARLKSFEVLSMLRPVKVL